MMKHTELFAGEDFVEIGFFDGAFLRMKKGRNGKTLFDANVVGQMRIYYNRQSFSRNVRVRKKIDHLSHGMHAGIRSATGGESNLFAERFFNDVFYCLLDGHSVFLPLKADIIFADVFENKAEILRRRIFHKIILAQKIKLTKKFDFWWKNTHTFNNWALSL